jgi:hypothetical protein
LKTIPCQAELPGPDRLASLIQDRETPIGARNKKQGETMEKKLVRIIGIFVLMLGIISCAVFGCSQQPAPPAQTAPPAGTVQTPPPGVSAQTPPQPGPAQTPAPVGTVQTPAPSVSAQMPASMGTAPATPSQDPSQVLVGMTPEQVYQIMGSPGQLYQKGFIEWKYSSTPQGKVDIRFQNNKVILVEKYKNQ